jgi:hypothetical protein
MTFRRRVQAAALALALLCSGMPAGAQDNSSFHGRLSPRPIDGRMRGQLTGVGEIHAVLEGNTLSIVGSFQGMQNPAVGASLHRGVDAGVAGPPFASLEVTRAPDGLVYGSATLDASLRESLERGALYVQIDGQSDEDGTLWGFLIRETQ